MIGIRTGAGRTKQRADEGDVTARLRDCHGRIRAFLAEADAIAADPRDSERRRVSASTVLRYFGVALPLHEADEDRSIAPRLAGGDVGIAEDHRRIDALVERLAEDWDRVARGESIEIDRHRDELSRLVTIFGEHLDREERELFPRIDALPDEERRAIVREMDARRR